MERFWHAAPSAGRGPSLHEILPDGNVDLVISLGASACRLHLYGPATRLAVTSIRKDNLHLAVRFLPGQAPRLMDIDPGDLLDARVELEALGGVAAAAGFGARQALLEELPRRACPAPMAGELCRHPGPNLSAAIASDSRASLIMLPGEGVLWIADGPLCTHQYQKVAL